MRRAYIHTGLHADIHTYFQGGIYRHSEPATQQIPTDWPIYRHTYIVRKWESERHTEVVTVIASDTEITDAAGGVADTYTYMH